MKAYATVLLPVIVLAAAAGVQGGTSMNPSPHAPAGTSDGKLESLFTAVLQYRSDSPASAVAPAGDREGAFIGSGDGTATGARLRGTVRWSLWSGSCVYPLIREGQKIPDGLHLCTMNPVGFIETPDGA